MNALQVDEPESEQKPVGAIASTPSYYDAAGQWVFACVKRADRAAEKQTATGTREPLRGSKKKTVPWAPLGPSGTEVPLGPLGSWGASSPLGPVGPGGAGCTAGR